MVEVKITSITGSKGSSVELPRVFNTPFRPDLIKRAVLSDQSKKRQPQGRYELAGKLTAATGVGPGRGISLVPRTHGSRTHHASRGAVIPSTRGGRLAHPPKVEKKIVEHINKKEYFYALRSAVSATKDREVIEKRGHWVAEDADFPIIVEDNIKEVIKTSEMIEIIDNLGLGDDLERSKRKSIRSGKGKMRGRKYRRRSGPLIVVTEDCNAIKSGNNIPGVSVKKLEDLDVEDLAPGSIAGRATVWTESALEKLSEWKW